MADIQEKAEKLNAALKSKKGVEEIFVDVIINNDLEKRLLIAKKYGDVQKSFI